MKPSFSRLRGDVVLGTLDQGAASVLAFVFHVIAARVYDNSVYGWLVLVWGGVALAVLVWRAAIGVPFVVEYSEASVSHRVFLLDLLRASTRPAQLLLLAIAGGLGAFGVAFEHALAVPSQLAAASAFLLFACLHRETWRHALLGGLETGRLAVLGVVANLTAVALFSWAALSRDLAASVSLMALGGGMLLGVLVARPQVERLPHVRLDLVVVTRWWRFGQHILLGVLSTTGATQLILWWLLFFRGDEHVAIFGAVFAAVSLPRPVLNAITAVLTPSLARIRGSKWEGWRARRTMLTGGAAGALFVLCAVLFGPSLMAILFPTIPAAERSLIGVLALVVVFEGVNAIVRGVIRGGGHPRIESSAAIVGGGTGLAIGLVTVPLFGLGGAAVALLLMQVGFAGRGVVVLRALGAAEGAAVA